MKKQLLSFFIMISSFATQAQEVEIQFGKVTSSGPYADVELLMKNSVELIGVEIFISGATLVGAYGGKAGQMDWYISTDSILNQLATGGKQMGGMPVGDTVLIHLLISNASPSKSICIGERNFGEAVSAGGGMATSALGADSCITITALYSNIDQKEDYHVFPNPSADGVFNITGTDITSIEVYDAFGKQILTEYTLQPAVQINLSAYAKGVYFLRINTEKENSIQRLMHY